MAPPNEIADVRSDMRRLSSDLGDIRADLSSHNVEMTRRFEELKGLFLVQAEKENALDKRVVIVEKKQDEFEKFKNKGLVFGLMAFAMSGGFGAGVAHLIKKLTE